MRPCALRGFQLRSVKPSRDVVTSVEVELDLAFTVRDRTVEQPPIKADRSYRSLSTYNPLSVACHLARGAARSTYLAVYDGSNGDRHDRVVARFSGGHVCNGISAQVYSTRLGGVA